MANLCVLCGKNPAKWPSSVCAECGKPVPVQDPKEGDDCGHDEQG